MRAMLSIGTGPWPGAWQPEPRASRRIGGGRPVPASMFQSPPPVAVRLVAAAIGATTLCAVSRRSRGGSRGGEEHSVKLSPQTHAATASVADGENIVRGVTQDLLSAPDIATAGAGDNTIGAADFWSTPSNATAAQASDKWVISLLYDGDCHLCMKQVEFLTKRMDENPEYAGLVRLTNLANPDYDPAKSGGVTFQDGMRHIHAVTRDGEVVTGMDVFRRVYSAIGMEWVYTLTKLPFLGEMFDRLYDVWAEHRLHLTGREDIIEKVRQHQRNIEELTNHDECEVTCEIDWDNL